MIVTTVALLVCMIVPVFSGSFAVSVRSASDSFLTDEPVEPLSEKKNAAWDAAASGDQYDLPFVPIETEHRWDKGKVTVPPTCTEPGVKTYTCRINPAHTYTEPIPATGHTPDEAVIENLSPATCCAAGSYDEVVYCFACEAELSREHKTIPIDADAHDWGEWVLTAAPTETLSGSETRTCKHDPNHTETREIPALGTPEDELAFFDGEVTIVVPEGAVPEGASFDVQEVVSPPAEAVGKVKEQIASSSRAFAYSEVRLTDSEGSPVIHLDAEITIRTKMSGRYIGSDRIRVMQEDEHGNLVVMESWWEGEYLCYKTDWLEVYN